MSLTRRALIRNVTAAILPSVCGCADSSGGTAPGPPQASGLEGALDTTVCGAAIVEPCTGFTETGAGLRGSVVIDEQPQGRVAVDRTEGRLLVGGFIDGIGDTDCRRVAVSSVRLTDGTLSVVVRNSRPESVDSCAESAELVRYQIVLDPVDARRVARLDVTHYDHTGQPQLSGTVSVRVGRSGEAESATRRTYGSSRGSRGPPSVSPYRVTRHGR